MLRHYQTPSPVSFSDVIKNILSICFPKLLISNHLFITKRTICFICHVYVNYCTFLSLYERVKGIRTQSVPNPNSKMWPAWANFFELVTVLGSNLRSMVTPDLEFQLHFLKEHLNIDSFANFN